MKIIKSLPKGSKAVMSVNLYDSDRDSVIMSVENDGGRFNIEYEYEEARGVVKGLDVFIEKSLHVSRRGDENGSASSKDEREHEDAEAVRVSSLQEISSNIRGE